MNTAFDVIVAGLGAVGSATVYHLARRGRRVLGLDRFAPPHSQGSSHGGSRIIRRAYFEGAQYLPLLERAYRLWWDLEEASGEALLHLIGALNIGPPDGAVVTGARRVAEVYGLRHEVLSGREAAARFPAFRVPEGHTAVWDAEAGWLDPEACVRVHLEQARRHGAVLHFGEPATGWRPDGDGVQVSTGRAVYRAGHLVLCAGGWIRDLLAGLGLPLTVERQVNGWFRPKAPRARFDPSRCPVFMWEHAPDGLLYGFPDLGRGVKAGLHHQGRCVDHPDALQRDVTPADEAALRACLGRLLPDADGAPIHAATCFYTNTPDRHYLIDRHPAFPQVSFASACSGHGFKASNAVGEALADRASGARAHVDLAAFRLRAFGPSQEREGI